jgi:hypothetical protein
VLISLELRRDCSADCRAAFSLARARSAADRAAFSSDIIFFSSAIEAENPEKSRSQKGNHMLESVKEERVPF